MATELDNDLVPEIAVLIQDELGTDATFKVKASGGVYSTATSALVSPAVYTDTAWKISPPQPYSAFLVDGDVIQAGDLKTITSAQGITFTPSVTDAVGSAAKLVFGGFTWTILAVSPIRSGDLICAYEMQLRRGPGA